jgi:hypothetical protein
MVMDYLHDFHTNLPGLQIFKLAMLRKKCMKMVESKYKLPSLKKEAVTFSLL